MRKYVAFVGTEGGMPEEALAEMNRDWPAYKAELERRGTWRFGRELEFPETAVTVRARDGETLVVDGPFAETKEYVAGMDVFECADLDEAIEVEGLSPVARFLPFEIRPLRGELRLGGLVDAFAGSDDTAGIPYLLSVWADGASAESLEDPAVLEEYAAWQQDLDARGAFALGGLIGGPETATTLRDGGARVSDGSFLELDEYVAGVDVVCCSERAQAVEAAAAHPLARSHTVEVRPFYSEAGHPEHQDESPA